MTYWRQTKKIIYSNFHDNIDSTEYTDIIRKVNQRILTDKNQYGNIEVFDKTIIIETKNTSYLVALDNGHGSETPGKRTPKFDFGPRLGEIMHEGEFNYDVVKRISNHLQRIGLKTILVSDTKNDTSLSIRTTLAVTTNADIFISIHANVKYGTWWTDDPVGIETFIDKSQVGKESNKLATFVQTELISATSSYNLPDRGVKSNQSLHVTRELPPKGMPSILTESGFMDSRYDAKLLIDSEYRR